MEHGMATPSRMFPRLAMGIFLCLLSCANPPIQPMPNEYDTQAMEQLKQANGYFEQGQYTQAVPLYKQVIRIRKYLPEPYTKLGLCYERLGQDRAAVELYEQYEMVDLDDVDNLKRLLRLYEKLGQTQKAEEARERLATLQLKSGGEQ